jgi:hypothetical protein
MLNTRILIHPSGSARMRGNTRLRARLGMADDGALELGRSRITPWNTPPRLRTPARSHPIARGRAGPKRSLTSLFSKFGLHLPLNRHPREGVDLAQITSTSGIGVRVARRQPNSRAAWGRIIAAVCISLAPSSAPIPWRYQPVRKSACGRRWQTRPRLTLACSAEVGATAASSGVPQPN